MIAEAVDTAVTVAWALLAWITAMAAVATVVLLGLIAGVWWLARAARGAWRGVTGPLWARGRVEARMFARARVRASTGRVRLRSARVPRSDTDTTGPPRLRNRGCGASEGGRGAFPAPATPKSSQGRTELSITKEVA